ncbi:hypothetical protein N7532_010848 [Penicillium argentinense]|uniref:PLC-like phosphodiesterase n=1 Tax=Penicillium argentinense TaxID=1131581 RepID=A0A9W9EQD0_9EURO|nr:uncharacterized protein N7532_010848 [Penicillium argentinense]KAJ5086077.1 hypothetical protein N7532_010848 [Penicillium argentinense]
MSSIQERMMRVLLGALLLFQTVLGVPSKGQIAARELTSSATTAAVTAATCNGRTEYCDRSYSNVTFIGSHDSAFVGKLPQQNQNIDIKAQLDMGVRFLQAQTHHSLLDDSVLELCHTSCVLEDAGTLESFLGTIKDWLDANTNEVVTLLLTNGDSVDITDFGDTFSNSGIADYAFAPLSSPDTLPIDEWPTIGELISSGKRLVVFLDYGTDTTKVDYILNEFNYYFETAYDVTDSSFSNCSIDRPFGASASGRMYIVNHFLDVDIFGVKIPDRQHAARTNAATGDGSIGGQASLCEDMYDRAPNAILLDFVDEGDAINAQNSLNGF